MFIVNNNSVKYKKKIIKISPKEIHTADSILSIILTFFPYSKEYVHTGDQCNFTQWTLEFYNLFSLTISFHILRNLIIVI
jgi:hypothetical protein